MNQNIPLIGQRRPKILLGTPTSFQMLTITSHYVLAVHEHLRASGFQVGWQPTEGSMVERNQNALCKKAIDERADVLLLIDSDMSGDPTVPQRLYNQLRMHGKDILCCDYRSRVGPHAMCGRKLNNTNNTGAETGIEEMLFMPSGMMMISRRALLGTKYPWFLNIYGDSDKQFNGNDYNFCQQARAAGFKIWCEHDLSNGIFHNVVVPLSRQMTRIVDVPLPLARNP